MNLYGSLFVLPEYLPFKVPISVDQSKVGRHVFVESSAAGLSRYLVIHAGPEEFDAIVGSVRLPPSIKPAITSKSAQARSPQKVLMLMSEGRHVIPSGSLARFKPKPSPAYRYIVGRLLYKTPNPDDVLRMLAAMEDRKAYDAEAAKEAEKYVRNVLTAYLGGILNILANRRHEAIKLLSAHVRPKALSSARIDLDRPLTRKHVERLLREASKHMRGRNPGLLEYPRGSRRAALIVFTRELLNAAYVYELIAFLGEAGYDVKEVIVGHDSFSADLAKRVADTLNALGHVSARTMLFPRTPVGIIAEFLKYLIREYESRGTELFIDGRGGSPATFLATLRTIRGRLVLPDKRVFLFSSA